MVSHALAHTSTVEARGTRTTVGMIGMVYTDPKFRGRGAAQLAVRGAVERLHARGASLVILWSDLDAFYARLGFHRAGIEHSYCLDAELCERMYKNHLGEVQVRAPRDDDWPHLERLYSEKPSRQIRAIGSLRQLARTPDCETLVAIQDDRPIAYASMGRGDDLTGIVHEWGGASGGLIRCLNEFARSRGEVALLEGPVPEPATQPLREVGAPKNVGTLGLIQLLDAQGLFKTIARDQPQLRNMHLTAHPHHDNAYTFSTPHADITLSHQSALSLLFGPSLPRSLQLGLEADECHALRICFPWPLFVWGFDSI